MSAVEDKRDRVLVLAPSGRDAVLTQAVLQQAGVASAICPDLGALCDALDEGAAAALITEDAFVEHDIRRLVHWTGAQEPWSDLPFIVLWTRENHSGGAHELGFLRTSANISLLERPVTTGTLVSAVKAALRARRRQYEVKDTLAALAQSEQRYRTLAEALPQLVWSCHADGTCDYVNRRWVEYTGIDDARGQGSGWFEAVVHPDDRQRSRERWAAAAAGRSDYDLEHRIRRADGTSHWF